MSADAGEHGVLQLDFPITCNNLESLGLRGTQLTA